MRVLACLGLMSLLPALAAAQVSSPPPPPLGDGVQIPPTSTLPYSPARTIDGAELPPPPPPPPATTGVQYVAPRPVSDEAPPPPPAQPTRTITIPAPPAADQDQVPPPAPAAATEPEPTPAPAATPEPSAAAAATPPADEKPAPVAAAKADESSGFVKGELSSVGVDQLISRKDRVVVGLGYNHIGYGQYLLVYPQLGLRFGELSLGLGVPLNLEIYNGAYPKDPAPGDNHIIQFKNMGSIRKEDWDEVSEYARVLSYLTYGKKEDNVYLDVGQQHSSTLGHGAIMRHYTSNVDVNSTKVGAQFDAYGDYAGFEAMTNDIMLWSVMGLLGFVKPLSILGADSTLAKSLSIGGTFAIDRQAPTSLQFVSEPWCPVPGACRPANVVNVDDTNHLMANRSPVSLAGVDMELKLLKTDSVDLKPYVDYSRMLTSAVDGTKGGGGFTAGVLGRFNAGLVVVHAFRLVAEVRALQANYVPGYFDTFYEIDKYLINGTGGVKAGSGGVPLTKFQATVGPNGAPGGTGYYFEASYGVRDVVGLTFSLEGQTNTAQKNFLAHFELPAFSWLQLFASLYKRGFTDFSTIFSLDDNAIAFAGARVKILPILFLNLRAYKTFQLDAYEGKDGPLGTLQYANVTGYSGELDFGWEF